MLATILFILKIIGLILLGILGLLLVLLLLVLLVPVRYRAEGSFCGTPKGKAAVSWLLHLFSVQVGFERELEIGVRVFGVRLKAFSKEKPEEGQTEQKKEKAADAGGTPDEGASKPPDADKKPGKGAPKPPDAGEPPGRDGAGLPQRESGGAAADADGRREASVPKTEAQAEDRARGLEEEERRAAKKRREAVLQQPAQDQTDRPGPLEKVQAALGRICDKLGALKQKKDSWEAFFRQEENQRTLRLVWRQFRRLLRHVLPQRIEGRIRFGFDDPYKTGQILTYISPFYGLYARHLELIPVFDEPAMEGELRLKGRIRVGTVLALAVRVFMDKNVRKLLGRLRKR